MKKVISITGVLIVLALSFFAGMKWNEILYDDICLDMGGGMNPGGHKICIIEKLVTEKTKEIKDEPVEEIIDIPNSNNPIMCTMDAKQCPDGSYVGRTGPNCEFEKCPSE